MIVFHKVFVLLALFVHLSITLDQSNVVNLPQGKIAGFYDRTTLGRPMRVFYGVPYAQPPVKELRFQDPLPAKPWNSVLNATTPSPACLQFHLVMKLAAQTYQYLGQEDCLYLNIYTPKISCGDKLLPVMVYIHGGGYLAGSAIEHEGHDLLDEDVILVSINYRLGVLGFTSTEDDVMPGNYGLKDQVLALQWIQENIHHFGGDKNRVTLFGHSAGGSSIQFLLMSPFSKGLFHRVIMQSGNALCPWSYSNSHYEDSYHLANTAVCPLPSRSIPEQSKKYLECLKTKDALDLTKHLESVIVTSVGPIKFSPRIDGKFLPLNPESCLLRSLYEDVDIMIGNAKDDGGFITYGQFMFDDDKARLSQLYGYNMSSTLGLDNEPNYKAKTRKTYEFYHLENPNQLDPEQVKEMLSDRQFRLPTYNAAILHSKNYLKTPSNIYYYKFVYKGVRSMGLAFQVTFGKNWVQHGDELPLLFPMKYLGGYPDRTADDAQMSRTLVKLWTNFAITGNPTPDDTLGFQWPAISVENPTQLLVLDSKPVVINNDMTKVQNFWSSLGLVKENILCYLDKIKRDEF